MEELSNAAHERPERCISKRVRQAYHVDAQTWAWLIFIVGQLALVPAAIRMGRAKDPRDSDGRKVPFDPARFTAAKRLQIGALIFWSTCVVGSSIIRIVDRPDLLAREGIMLGLLAVALSVVAGLSMAGARRRRGDSEAT